MSVNQHTNTPTLSVFNNRALVVREVAWHRIDKEGEPQARITRHQFDNQGRLRSSIDPRLYKNQADKPNFRYQYSLSHRQLRCDSVDAGSRQELFNAQGLPIASMDSRGTLMRQEYDQANRLIARYEKLHNEHETCTDRMTYGPPDAENNARGQLIRHDDPAGSQHTSAFSLSGKPLAETRFFLRSMDTPNWPLPLAEREALLEAEGYTTRWHFAASGEVLEQTDAANNKQRHRYTLSGAPAWCEVELADKTIIPVLSEIEYSVFGQAVYEKAGNNVITRREFRPTDQRLLRILVRGPAAEGRANGAILQDLNYSYDAIGNVLSVRDNAHKTRYFRNQRIDLISQYRYDSLSQLIQATGQESVNAGQQGPQLPACENPDSAQLRNYTRDYRYDEGNNLLTMRHIADKNNYTQTMVVSPTSNRSVRQTGGIQPEQVDSFFDANGNLMQLTGNQQMTWDGRNQLQSVALVQDSQEP